MLAIFVCFCICGFPSFVVFVCSSPPTNLFEVLEKQIYHESRVTDMVLSVMFLCQGLCQHYPRICGQNYTSEEISTKRATQIISSQGLNLHYLHSSTHNVELGLRINAATTYTNAETQQNCMGLMF